MVGKYTIKGWYKAGVKRSGFPYGAGSCVICRKAVREDEVVYAFRMQTGYSQSVVKLMHKECMKSELDNSPYTKFEEIKLRVETGGPFFD